MTEDEKYYPESDEKKEDSAETLSEIYERQSRRYGKNLDSSEEVK